VRHARRRNPGNPELEQFEREHLPPFRTEQLSRLEELALGLATPLDRLIELARACAPGDGSLHTEDEDEDLESALRRVIDGLSVAMRQSANGIHPLHAFALRLAREASGPAQAGALRAWIEETGGTPERAGALPAARRVAKAYLFVKCDSGDRDDVGPADEVELTAWLWRIGPDARPIGDVPDRVLEPLRCRLDEVPAVLGKLRKSRLSPLARSVGPGNLTIEFCLRHNLFCAEVERWRLQLGKDSELVLGETYPVVVRSFDRIYDPDLVDTWEFWKSKWERLQRDAEAGEAAIEWICHHRGFADPDAARRLQRSHVLCIALALSVDPKLLMKSIEAGTPAAVWVRRAGDAADLRAKLAGLLSDRLGDLPARIYEERQKMHEARHPLTDHLAVLWDDFDRIPPDAAGDLLMPPFEE
jgi:hypothetical protein